MIKAWIEANSKQAKQSIMIKKIVVLISISFPGLLIITIVSLVLCLKKKVVREILNRETDT
jgi:hypothetical protein